MKTTNLEDILIEQPYFYGGTENGKPFLNTLGRELKAQLEQLIREQRLIELDLLEQAINQGRDMNKYKMMRLEALTDSNKDDHIANASKMVSND